MPPPDLSKVLDALLQISPWPWEKEDDDWVHSRDDGRAVISANIGSGTQLVKTGDAAFIASSPLWLAELLVGMVEEKANHLCWINAKYGPLAEFIPMSLRSFNLDPAKWAELRKRMEGK